MLAESDCRALESREFGEDDVDRNWFEKALHLPLLVKRAAEQARRKGVDHPWRKPAADVDAASRANHERCIAGKSAEPGDEQRERFLGDHVAPRKSAREHVVRQERLGLCAVQFGDCPIEIGKPWSRYHAVDRHVRLIGIQHIDNIAFPLRVRRKCDVTPLTWHCEPPRPSPDEG